MQDKAHAGRAKDKDRALLHQQPSDTESSDGGQSNLVVREPAPARFVAAGRISPSGNITKRARVDPPSRPGAPLNPDADHRVINPLPTRKSGNEKKRKRTEVPSLAPIHAWKQAVHVDAPPAVRWPSQSLPDRRRYPEHANDAAAPPGAMAATTPMYPGPGFAGAPFGHQPAYAPIPGFVGPPYGPPAYGPTYAPQGWAHPPQHNQHQQWLPQAQFNPEEYDVMMRHGGYQG